MPNQPKNCQNDKGMIIYREYSTDEGDPYYPVPNEIDRALYRKYQDLALKARPCTITRRIIVQCVIYFYLVNHTFLKGSVRQYIPFIYFSTFLYEDNFCSKE